MIGSLILMSLLIICVVWAMTVTYMLFCSDEDDNGTVKVVGDDIDNGELKDPLNEDGDDDDSLEFD